MHSITEWEAGRSGTGITVHMTDDGGNRRKQFVKKIISKKGTVTAIGGDGTRFKLAAGRETSPEVAAIAGEMLALRPHDLDNVGWDDMDKRDLLLSKVHTLAASALGQHVA